MPIDLNF